MAFPFNLHLQSMKAQNFNECHKKANNQICVFRTLSVTSRIKACPADIQCSWQLGGVKLNAKIKVLPIVSGM